MTSLLSAPARLAGPVVDPRHRRPLVLVAALGGVVAAGALLVVCLGVAVTGWFLTDAASHGAPRDALRIGALGWLMGHGSGIRIQGIAVTAVPLLLTLLAAWSCWRIGHRVGSSVSGHGPDADQIADGERDWTVPVAAACFALGYVVVTLVTASLAGTPKTAPSTSSAVGWSLFLTLAIGGPAIAVGSGRAAIWTAMLPGNLRATAASCRAVLRSVLLASLATFVVALAVDTATAINVLSELRLATGELVVFVVLSLLVLPNATLFSASYLLGPGFTVGAQTLRVTHRRGDRRPARVPAARRTSRQRSGAEVDGLAGRRPAARRRARCRPRTASSPHRALGGGRAPGMRRRRGGRTAARVAGDSRRRRGRSGPDALRRDPCLRRLGPRGHRTRYRRTRRWNAHDLVAAADPAADELVP